ncbi:MAG: S8 family serine peptidase [Prevotellaceae bacterium]|nr:S8 family serine peptidase [Prevotellaceae bacterium]
MVKVLFLILFFATVLQGNAKGIDEVQKVKYPGGKTYMFRVTFKDKNGTPYKLSQPLEFLSAKALSRRTRQHLQLDSTDLPINPEYIKAINATGANVVSRSKWNNTVLVRSHNLDVLKGLSNLSCVKETKKVWTSPDSITPVSSRAKYHTEFKRWNTVEQSHYGVATEQNKMVGCQKLHNMGYTGRGITIAVLDGGFMNVDLIPCMQEVDIVGWKDFVVPASPDIFKEMDHGTKVLSVMAANVPNTFVGTAPGAAYWLLRCEDNQTESQAEEDYWAAAVEFADSVGVDIISSSLGFHAFDDSSTDYRYSDLDGYTALISRSASMLAGKGIILVNSAGNDGMGTWKKINVPADADNILSVGAVTPNRRNAAFSSIGPSADGRIKPDIMAQGSPTTVITGRGTIIDDMGTSFSTPVITGMVACLWQSCRDKTALEIINLVRLCSDNSVNPDNIYGYGIPDFVKAFDMGRNKKRSK